MGSAVKRRDRRTTTMHQIAKYEVIFLLCILIKSASTAKMKTTCKGAVETGTQDFKTINVTKTTSKNCGFSLSSLNLARLSKDLVLFDTARMNCQGGEVRFPTSGPGKKNYCDSDRCKVYTRKLNSYNRNDVLETVRNHFPTCAGYDIQRKVEKDITVQKQTTSFTLRYKVLKISLATTAIPKSSAATEAGHYSSATAPYSLSQTESETARDEGGVTTAVPDGTSYATSLDVTSSTTEDGVSHSNQESSTDKEPVTVKDLVTDKEPVTTTEKPSSNLSAGQIAGITIPILLIITLVVVAVILYRSRKKEVYQHEKMGHADEDQQIGEQEQRATSV